MRRRSRTRYVLTLAGTVLCLLMLLGFFLSLKWSFHYVYGSSWRDKLLLTRGVIVLRWASGNRKTEPFVQVTDTGILRPARGFNVGQWRPSYIRPFQGLRPTRVTYSGTPGTPGALAAVGYQIPLWIPFCVVFPPTAFLLWRDRGFRKGCCQHCGYDLTGNVSGICPECGERI